MTMPKQNKTCGCEKKRSKVFSQRDRPAFGIMSFYTPSRLTKNDCCSVHGVFYHVSTLFEAMSCSNRLMKL